MMDTKESFIEMRKKLVALQREIQEVMDKEDEDEHVVKNPLKRSRSASSPPPLIPIHEVNIDEEEDAMDFLQVSMAHDSKRVKRTRRSQQPRDWNVMHVGAKVEPTHDE